MSLSFHSSQDYSRVSLSGLSNRFLPATPSSSCSSLPSLDVARSEPPKASRRLFSDIERISKTGKKFKVKTSRMISQLKKEADCNKEKVENQNKKIVELDQKIDQQNEIIQQQNAECNDRRAEAKKEKFRSRKISAENPPKSDCKKPKVQI